MPGRQMNREEAIIVLSEESARISNPVIVRNKAHQTYLVSHNPCVPLGEEKSDILVCLDDDKTTAEYVMISANRERQDYIQKMHKEHPAANYFFIDYDYITHTKGGEYSTKSHLLLDITYVPFALVSKREVDDIKLHYGGMGYPESIREAATLLGADLNIDYIKLYGNDPEKFKAYFSNIKSGQDAEHVVRLIAESDKRNDTLDEWLTEKFGGITEKVLRDKV